MHVASTCYWETDPPTYVGTGDSGYSDRLEDLKGSIFRWRSRTEGSGFEALLHHDSLLGIGSEPERLYCGPSLADAVSALNERLDRLEHDEGLVASPRNDHPKRLDADALIVRTLQTESFIDREEAELGRRRVRRGRPGGPTGGTPKL